MKKILLLASVLAIVFSCTTMDHEVQPENDLATQSVADRNYYGYSPDQMEMITLPSGIVVGKVGDRYILGDDMILSDKQLEELSQPATRGNIEATMWFMDFGRWPNGMVPYEIHPSCSSALRNNIIAAINEFHLKTFIRFIPRTNQTDYVEIYEDRSDVVIVGGLSYVGMLGGCQGLEFRPSASKEIILHELAHTVGLLHEHQRIDRDDYLTIDDWDLVNPAFFKQGYPHGPFNFNSVTMYPGIARADGNGTTTAVDRLSYGDAMAINAAYDFPEFMPFTEPTVSYTVIDSDDQSYPTTLHVNKNYTFDLSIVDPELRLYDHGGYFNVTITNVFSYSKDTLLFSHKKDILLEDHLSQDVISGLEERGLASEDGGLASQGGGDILQPSWPPVIAFPITYRFTTMDNFNINFTTTGNYTMTVQFGDITKTFSFEVQSPPPPPYPVFAKIVSSSNLLAPGLHALIDTVIHFFYDSNCTQRIDYLPYNATVTVRVQRVTYRYDGTPLVEYGHDEDKLVYTGASSLTLPIGTDVSGVYYMYTVKGCNWGPWTYPGITGIPKGPYQGTDIAEEVDANYIDGIL